MNITRRSVISGIVRTLDLPITEDQLNRYLSKQGLIQEIMPNLSLDEREFIMTGITSDEWDEGFGDA